MNCINGWADALLEEVVIDMQPGFARSPSLVTGKFPHLRTNNITPEGNLNLSKLKYISATDYEIEKYSIHREDILFNNTNSDVLVGKTAFVYNDVKAVYSNHLTRLRVDRTKVDPEFLAIYLQNLQKTGYFKSIATRWVNQAAVNTLALKKLRLRLPPLRIQMNIAKILSNANRLYQKRKHADKHPNIILHNIFLDFFGDSLQNPKQWKTKKIGEISKVVRGSSPRPKGDPKYFGGKIPRLMIADITRDGSPVYPRIDSLTDEGARKSRCINRNTLVIAVSGNVGLTSIVAVDCCIHDGFVALLDVSNEINVSFLREYLESIRLVNVEKSSGAIWKNLTTTEIREIEIPIPPLNLQNKFANVLEQINKIKIHQSQSSQEITELRQSLELKAFKGELVK